MRNALTSQLEYGIKRAKLNVDSSAAKTVFFTHNYDEEFSSIVRQVKETFAVTGLNVDEDKAKEEIYYEAGSVAHNIILELENKYPITDPIVVNSSISCTVHGALWIRNVANYFENDKIDVEVKDASNYLN